MIGHPGTTCVGLEYFCLAGDARWSRPDDGLIGLGKRELAQLGLVHPDQFKDGTVVRMEKPIPSMIRVISTTWTLSAWRWPR